MCLRFKETETQCSAALSVMSVSKKGHMDNSAGQIQHHSTLVIVVLYADMMVKLNLLRHINKRHLVCRNFFLQTDMTDMTKTENTRSLNRAIFAAVGAVIA